MVFEGVQIVFSIILGSKFILKEIYVHNEKPYIKKFPGLIEELESNF